MQACAEHTRRRPRVAHRRAAADRAAQLARAPAAAAPPRRPRQGPVTPERAWLWVQFKNTLAGLDPATGELASATAFAEFSGNDIRQDDLQFGVLWLHSMRWDRPARLPWAAVDLATGEVLHAGPSVVARDETAAIQTMLGG